MTGVEFFIVPFHEACLCAQFCMAKSGTWISNGMEQSAMEWNGTVNPFSTNGVPPTFKRSGLLGAFGSASICLFE